MMVRTGVHMFPRQDRIVYGRAAAEVLDEETSGPGLEKCLIITSRSVAKTRFLQTILTKLGSRVAGVYADVAAHSPVEAVLDGADMVRRVDADVLVAVGGGSVIDAAKVMQICLWHNIADAPALEAYRMGEAHDATAQSPSLRMIAVPTTLSAAEFTSIAGITDLSRGIKSIFSHPYIIPKTVVLDPAATLHTPDRLFLGSGIRAVDHCVETLCSNAPTSFGDATAQEGLQLLASGLRAVKANPADTPARLGCQLGAWLAISGSASGVPTGASHAIGRVLGGAFGVPHGETSCVLLPGVLRWNGSHDDGAQARVAETMGESKCSAAVAVASLVEDLGLPGTLKAVGVVASHFDEIAEKSLVMIRNSATSGNRRPVTSVRDVKEILSLVEG